MICRNTTYCDYDCRENGLKATMWEIKRFKRVSFVCRNHYNYTEFNFRRCRIIKSAFRADYWVLFVRNKLRVIVAYPQIWTSEKVSLLELLLIAPINVRRSLPRMQFIRATANSNDGCFFMLGKLLDERRKSIMRSLARDFPIDEIRQKWGSGLTLYQQAIELHLRLFRRGGKKKLCFLCAALRNRQSLSALPQDWINCDW